MHLRISSLIAATLFALSGESHGAAFVDVSRVDTRIVRTRSSTELHISSWGSRGPPSRHQDKAPVDPSKSIQSYLAAPEPAASRPNLDGTVLVSGFANDRDRLDQRIFDLLNHEDSAFDFDRIVAFVDDVSFAKKRLVSRTARYSGLLNKLGFLQADHAGSLPTAEQLGGVKSWVAHVGNDLSLISKIGQLVKFSDVENVSVLLTGATELDVYQSEDAVRSLRGGGKTFTVVAVGGESKIDAEGSFPYAIREFGTRGGKVPAGHTYSRDEGIRLVVECLGLECAKDRALAFTEVRDVNATETRLIMGLREAGYSWAQEIEHMIEGGMDKYEAACQEYETKMVGTNTEEESWMAREEEKLRKAQEEEMERQAAREAEWLRDREEAMEKERTKMEKGAAEWA